MVLLTNYCISLALYGGGGKRPLSWATATPLQVCVCVHCSGVCVCVRESGGVRYLSGVPLQGFVCVCSRKVCV